MKMNFRFILLCFTISQTFNLSGFSQNDAIRLERSTGLQLSGSTRIDYFYDTRQTFEVIEGLATIYTQNTTESMMVGGYAVSAIDPATGHEKYTPTQYMNYWINVDYGKKWQAGFFAGYLNSSGTLENVTDVWYARAHDIKYMYRINH